MVADPSKLNGTSRSCDPIGSTGIEFGIAQAGGVELISVLHAQLQPLTTNGDTTHPTGFMRDGYCWGSENDPGKHYIGGVVTQEFLEFSKQRGELVSYVSVLRSHV